jgi:plasmid stabilization system protein ParE
VKIEFHSRAAAELDEAVNYYNQQAPGLGRELADEVRGAVSRIQDRPEAWTLLSNDGIRRCVTHRFPYGIIYQVQPQRVVIIAVAHLRRRPGYWRPRVS